MTTRHPRLAPRVERLEDRTVPAFLRLVQAPGGVTGFGSAGTDPNNPSQTSSEFATTADLVPPYGPRVLGAVTTPVAASSTLRYTTTAPAGLFTTLGGAVPARAVVFDVTSTINKPAGLNGGGSTIYTYGLDPNVILAPLTYEVVADAGEVAGQAVTLSFGYRADGAVAGTQVAGFRQDAGLTVNGTRTSLLSRNVQVGDPNPALTGGVDVAVKVGDRIGFDFTQAETAAGLTAGSGTATLRLGLAVGTGAAAVVGAGVVGAGAGAAPAVKLFNDDGTVALSFFAFDPAFAGGVRVAAGDVTGDGTPDVIAGTGPGRATLVTVFDGKTGAAIGSLTPFEAAFTGGVYVAAADIDGDGRADLAVTPDEGGGPRVRLFSGKTLTPLADFFGIDDPNFRGGARAAFGDLTGDGRADLVVAAGFGGGPRVAVYEGRSVAAGTPARAFNDLFVFEQTLRNGVFVAASDLDGDGPAELIVGGGPGGGPRVYALSGLDLAVGRVVPKANFFAGDPDGRGGVRVAVSDLDGDTRADLLAGAGSGSRVTAYLGKNVTATGTPPAFRDFDPFPGTTGGVFVG